jgi:glycosyltransferase involved in cell wall biosynthesis
MLFEPYRLWDDPPVIAYQRDDIGAWETLLSQLHGEAHLFAHCPGRDGRVFFRTLEQLQKRHPWARLHLMANSRAELDQYRSAFNLPSSYGPTSLFVDERTFDIRRQGTPMADAIYVARFEPWLRQTAKRIPLAHKVQSLKIVTFCLNRKHDLRRPFRQTFPELSHAWVNDHFLVPHRIAAELNGANVQLALSAAEGCMLAFTEGLFCGTPAVTTPCQSARMEFFDDQHVIICDPDPDSVARAVSEMIQNQLQRQQVRDRALQTVRRMRAEYVSYMSELIGVSSERILSHVFERSQGSQCLSFPIPRPTTQQRSRSQLRQAFGTRAQLCERTRKGVVARTG